MSMNRSRAFQVTCLLAACAGASIASAQDAQPTDTDVLSGPKVKETHTERSLVQRDFSGKVRRLELNPDEAAIDLLTLDRETRAKVNTILSERAAILDRAVIENLDLLVKAQSTTDRKGKLELAREFQDKTKDLTARGRLRDEVVKVLSKEQEERYRESISGYWEAMLADARQQGSDKKEGFNLNEVAAREMLMVVGFEIRRSYERQIGSKTKELEALLQKLGLTEEKESRLRNMFTEFFEKYRTTATPKIRLDFFNRVMNQLDMDQKRIVITELLGTTGRTSDVEATEPMADAPSDDHTPMKEEPMLPK
jgi:hypothetical protein